MAILTRQAIKEQIINGSVRIAPFVEQQLNVNSYDLTLANTLKVYKPNLDGEVPILDPTKPNKMTEIFIRPNGYIMVPGTLYLAQANEQIWSDKYVFELTGKSSLARLGLTVHETAGFSNLGHDFKYVMEMTVVHPVRVYPNMPIAQIFIHSTIGETEDYDGHYVTAQQGDDSIAEPVPLRNF